MKFSTKDRYRSEIFNLFENTIAYIAAALEVGDLCGEQPGVILRVEIVA